MLLYSHSLEDQKFFSFILFLKSILNGDKDSIYNQVVKNVLSEAKEYLAKRKDIYSLDRNNFQITIYLANNAKNTLNKINIEHVKKEDYQELISSLENRSLSQECHHECSIY